MNLFGLNINVNLRDRASSGARALGSALGSVRENANRAVNSMRGLNQEVEDTAQAFELTAEETQALSRIMNGASTYANKLDRQMQRLAYTLGEEVPESTREAYATMFMFRDEMRKAKRAFGAYSPEVMNARNRLNEYILSMDDATFKQRFSGGYVTDYGLEENLETVKKWYDGYRFGEAEVYNPWSVINYVDSCYKNKNAFAKPYWSNTSSNSIVKNLIEHADLSVRQEIEGLIEGGTITKPIHEDITYDDMNSTQDNLWNFLLFTGYLKKIREEQEDETVRMEMAIPNSEVRYVYKNAVLQWFEKKTEKKELTPLYESLLNGDCDKMAEILSENLMETISFYDYQESYYHGFLAGMLKNIGNYIVQSNRESGNGRPDILVRYPSVRGKAVIIEIKVSKSYQGLEAKCDEALEQIEDQKYEETLRQEGYQNIMKYGVAFYRKECMVKAAEKDIRRENE